jgi:hypothetical protein
MLILFLGCHTVYVGDVADISEVHSSSVFRVKVCMFVVF